MLYFWDSNVVIDLIDRNESVSAKLKAAYQKHDIRISDIVYYEVFRGFKWKDNSANLVKFEMFCSKIPIVYQSKASLAIAAEKLLSPIQNELDGLVAELYGV